MSADLPVLDDARCTGCADCAAVCPVACLEMAESLPWMPRPADCVGCAICVGICPVQALAMAPAEPA